MCVPPQRRRHNAVSDSGAASVMNTPARVLSAVLGRGGGNVGGGGDGRGAPYRHRPSSATGSGATVRPESGDPSRRGSRDEVSVGTGRRRGSLNFTLGDNGNNGRSLLSRITGRGKRGDGGGGSVNEGELLRMGVTIPRDVDRWGWGWVGLGVCTAWLTCCIPLVHVVCYVLAMLDAVCARVCAWAACPPGVLAMVHSRAMPHVLHVSASKQLRTFGVKLASSLQPLLKLPTNSQSSRILHV